MTSHPELVEALPLDQLDPHPDNPRIVQRDDVIDQIAAEIRRNGFGREHAIRVRPHNGRYQLVAGHNRREAAIRAGIDSVPAWVGEMDDDEAFMQLVIANAQGELSSLEIGVHAKEAAKRWQRGGGLTAYAERIGRSVSSLSMLRSAAGVYAAVRNLQTSEGFALADKPNHLYEISKTPPRVWRLLVAELARREWSVKEAAAAVADVNKFDIPEDWQDWLQLPAVVERYLQGRFSPDTVNRLVAAADDVTAWIEKNGWDPDSQWDGFVKWLRAEDITDRRQIGVYKAQLIEEKSRRDAERARQEADAAREAFVVPDWHPGPWQDHLDKLEDGSVALLLTDPPYGQGYQSDFRLDRSKPRKHEKIVGDDISAPDLLQETVEALLPKLAANAHVLVFCGWGNEPEMRAALERAGLKLRGSLIWDKQATGMGDPTTTFAPAHERILHAVKGSPTLYVRAADILRHTRADSSRHPTEKPVSLLAELIEATTAPGQLVADPFGGVASTAAAAKETERRWWSCELDEGYWQAGEERLLP